MEIELQLLSWIDRHGEECEVIYREKGEPKWKFIGTDKDASGNVCFGRMVPVPTNHVVLVYNNNHEDLQKAINRYTKVGFYLQNVLYSNNVSYIENEHLFDRHSTLIEKRNREFIAVLVKTKGGE